ncbi:hypothetical protein J132_10939 [Termitomyces sp. J132]|nr:hypothetical protein J132_10939 [Termitomyces sp. J132]
MTVICPHCQALHFDAEKLTKSTRNNPKFGMCCLQGQVNLPRLQDAPADLLKLLYGNHALSDTFQTSIHQYNAAFAFTSLGEMAQEEQSNHCDVVLHLHGSQLKQISHLHPYYTPLHYTIIFSTGQPGFHTNIHSHFGL